MRLKEHYFWLMWHYLGRGELLRCVQTCDLGIELARQLGSAPVQYGSIKALALTELGRYDLVDAALDEEVTDDEHPFGQANQAFARELPRCDRGVGAGGGCCVGRDATGRRLVAGVDAAGHAHGCHLAPCTRRDRYGGSDGGDRRHRRRQRDPPNRLGAAEVELAEGRVSEAREELERVVGPLTVNDLRRDLTHVLELLVRTC